MKIEVSYSVPPAPKTPAVGQLWRHRGGGSCYQRIEDAQGHAALEGVRPTSEYFFSVSVVGGFITSTPRKSDDIEILAPVGGVLKLEVVSGGAR